MEARARIPIVYKIGFALILTIALAELALRAVDWKQGRDADFYFPKHGMEDSYYIPHPYMGYALKPGFTGGLTVGHINNLGMRGADMEVQKPIGVVRVLCLGGSTTYGTHVSSEYNTYPKQLEVALGETAAPGVRFEVGNCGVPGYNSIENLIQLELKLLDLKPEAIVLYEGANDAPPILAAGFRADYAHVRQSWRSVEITRFEQFLLRWSRIFAWATRGTAPEEQENSLSHYVFVPDFRGFHVRTDTKIPDEGIAAFSRNIRNMVALARTRSCTPILCTFATCRSKQAPGEHTMLDTIARLNDETRAIAAETHSPLVDVAANLNDKSELFADWMHMNDLGSLRHGQLVAAVARPALLPAGGK
ncbi:MAG: SGNH/GDSL hydrolase family protein [Planctomycetes bacterium]|nr:SGNH/GDSL hydrolase family protein [Planctomycetota bacterium]